MKKLDTTKSEVYFRNKFVPFSEANVSVASSSVLYGLSIYTVFSANWNERKQQLYIFRLKDHYRRLVNSARIMNFADFEKNCPFSEFQKRMVELLKRNDVREDALVRVTIFIDELIAGTKIVGLKNSWSAFVYPFGEILKSSGIHVGISSWTRSADNAIPPRAKVNGNYVNSSLMKNEALQNGFDDAIALDDSGHVSEGTVANVFFVRDNKLVTPDPSKDILEGITRHTLLKVADQLGIKHEQRPVDRTELYIADEMFFCGSSARITPVLTVDKRPIGDGKVGKITLSFAKYVDSLQRGNEKDVNNWLHPIY